MQTFVKPTALWAVLLSATAIFAALPAQSKIPSTDVGIAQYACFFPPGKPQLCPTFRPTYTPTLRPSTEPTYAAPTVNPSHYPICAPGYYLQPIYRNRAIVGYVCVRKLYTPIPFRT